METGTILDSEVDRLSSLPDDLLYKILSYVDIIYSIRLSVLSSRLRFIWTLMPNLSFSSHEVYRISSRYNEFVNYVLSARDNKVDVSSVRVFFSYVEDPELSIGRILEYALSHNVQQLSVSKVSNKYFQFSPSQLSSKSLKHLTMIGTNLDCRSYSPWDFPALTTLYLQDVQLDNSSCILAMCQNLKNLTLDRCKVLFELFELFESDYSDDGFTINNSKLLSLTLKKVEWYVDFVYLNTPQLKNLIFVGKPPRDDYNRSIREFPGELAISACSLTYLHIKGTYFPKLSSDGFPSLEKVDLCISSPKVADVHNIRDLFQCLHGVKSLALSLEIVEILSTSEAVISHQPSPFLCLKSLKIYPSKDLKTFKSCILETCLLKSSLDVFPTQVDEEQEAMKVKLSAEVTNYLLGSSSNATFTMVSYEKARAIKITAAATHLMAVLSDILEETEAYTDSKRANVEWKKTLADSCPDFKMRIVPPGDTEGIFCILQNIKVLLTKVLVSKRAEMQACLSRLSAKTKTVVNKMVVDMKNQCDIEQHIISKYLDEIALSS